MAGVLGDEAPLGFDEATTALVSLVTAAKLGTSGRVPPADLFEILQKLQLSIGRAERTVIKEHQRQTEDALVEILLKGTAAPVGSPPWTGPNPGQGFAPYLRAWILPLDERSACKCKSMVCGIERSAQTLRKQV